MSSKTSSNAAPDQVYDLRFYGKTPSGKAIEVCDPRVTAAPRFLLPVSQISILADRREHLQRLITVQMPAWLAASNGLKPEHQAGKAKT